MNGTTLEAMRTALRGPVIGPQDPEYNESRKLYNAMIDKRRPLSCGARTRPM